MQLATKGLILHCRKRGSHTLFNLLTAQHGLIEVVSFNTSYSKSGRTALTQPYSLIECFLQHNDRGEYQLLSGKIIESYNQIGQHLALFYQAQLYSEACLSSRALGGDHRIFPFYCFVLKNLKADNNQKMLQIFILMFLYYNGTLPRLPLTAQEKELLNQDLDAIFNYPWSTEWQTLLYNAFTGLFTPSLKTLKFINLYGQPNRES